MAFALTARQIEANKVLGSDARHCMLYGGSRSGKTFLILRAIVTRALAHKSRHAALRYRFNHIKASIIYDTLPKVMEMCFPGVAEHCHLDKSDWFYKLPNGSEVWFGGLDDKERTEKILGQEYATLFFNECSQIPWASRNMAITRLAQNTPLRLKAYYDCNPPSEIHWTARVFINKLDPDTRNQLRDKDAYTAFTINPVHNRENLPPAYFQELELLPERMRRRFYLGQFGGAADNALWTLELLDKCRMVEGSLPDLARIVIAVDPSGCAGEEDIRSDEVGIVVVGLGTDGKGYLIEDLSGRFGPAQWGATVVAAYDRHDADCVVAETNFGGAMVAQVIRAARPPGSPAVPFREVKASRGKAVRAEPVSALYAQGKVIHVGFFEALEDQLCVVGGTLIETSRGHVPIESVRPGDYVMTRDGFAPVKQAGPTGVSSSLVQVCTPESFLEVTPCHPIFCQDRFVSARNVGRSDSLLVSRRWAAMGLQLRGAGTGITEWIEGIFATLKGRCCTETYTRLMSGLSQADGTSITAMVTQAITELKTWSAFAPLTTIGGMSLVDGIGNPAASLALLPPDRCGQIASRDRSCASSAESRDKQLISGRSSTVRSSVSDVQVIAACVPVYNLEVQDGCLPEYFANGILVHNCAMTTAGYTGNKSPDRADALVWGLHELFPGLTRREQRNSAPPTVNVGYAHLKRRRM